VGIAGTDTSGFKQREQETWARVAPGWRKHDEYLVRATAPVTERMLTLLRLAPGQRVLDIASGTGEPAIAAGERVGPGGSVVGIDFVEDMLVFARAKAAARNLRHVEFRCLDGERFDFPKSAFDAVSIRWGLMFMPDPTACLRRAYKTLKETGRIAVACWARPEQNPWASLPIAIIRRNLNAPPPPPETPGIFAFADSKRLRETLEQAGFRDVSVEMVDVIMADFDTGPTFFAFMGDLAGPIIALFKQLPADQQPRVADEIARQAAGPDGRVVLRGVSWVATGVK
jgi:ubiquinone/menaquinone biosynthesis C-methylase UbiE